MSSGKSISIGYQIFRMMTKSCSCQYLIDNFWSWEKLNTELVIYSKLSLHKSVHVIMPIHFLLYFFVYSVVTFNKYIF